MNNRRLRAVAKRILKFSSEFDMSYWHAAKPGTKLNPYDSLCSVSLRDIEDFELPVCQTAHCFAGWGEVMYPQAMVGGGSHVNGMEIFDITDEQADRLFYLQYWPRKYFLAIFRSKRPDTKARVLQRRVEHFIATKGAE